MIEAKDLAIIMVGLFLFIGVLFRSAWQFKTVGDSGIRLSSKLKTKKTISISILLFTTFVVQGFLAWAYSKSHLQAQIELGLFGSVLGIALCLFGLTLASYSQFSMRDSWRIGVDPDEKTKLITNGIYAKIRNPIYTACMIYGVGLILLAPHLFVLLTGLVGYVAIIIYVKQIEEPYLLKLHGDNYQQYLERTGSYLPKL